jgi:protein involved in polysaccharide export with SLBB domain
LTHSFLVRDGKRLSVDFEKLFQRGDLSQNIPLEPNDFLCFPPADLNGVYVLGRVVSPGTQLWEPTTTVISAITRRGSFTPDAYRQKVLVVRGSLNNPQTFVVDTAAILSARQPDFKLEPRDIVYVNSKPWTAAQQLLESAVASFVSAAFVTYTGEHIGPFIREPFIK